MLYVATRRSTHGWDMPIWYMPLRTEYEVLCPCCGSTVYLNLSKQPALIGVPVGAIADPNFPGPHVSIWEQSMHHWITIPDGPRHFPQGD